MWPTLQQIDQEATLFLNGFHYPFLDTLMLWITAKWTWVPLYLLIIYWIFREFHWKQAIFAILALVAAVGLADFITSGLMKPNFERLRPCHNPTLDAWLHTVGGCGGRYGFASSHAANTMALFSGIKFLFPDRKKIMGWILFWAIIVSYSRIYVGVHFLGDVLIGAIIGLAMGYVTIKGYRALCKVCLNKPADI